MLQSEVPTEQLQPSTLPEQAWSRLAADLFEFKKRHYLLIVDYYSRYIEVGHLESLGALTTRERVQSIFSVHGVPSVDHS